MLHIKLPKGKTAKALLARAEWYRLKAETYDQEYMRFVESWRKGRKAAQENMRRWPHIPVFGLPPQYLDPGFRVRQKKMEAAASACSFSAGDVYVSGELWDEIKGCYDA